MKTMAMMVSIGDRLPLIKRSFPRMSEWAARHGYSSALITNQLGSLERPPHYCKLLAPLEAPNFDRWVIIDDDLLISRQAPALPDLESGWVGLVPDAIQTNTHRPGVGWTGNTGFILVDRQGLPILKEAYQSGDASDIWGPYDQGALNAAAWKHERITHVDPRWNLAPIVEFFHTGEKWHRWNASKFQRLKDIAGLMSGINRAALSRVRSAWGLHLIHARKYAGFFDRQIP